MVRLWWKTEPYAGGGAADRPDLYDWDGRYWSGALDATSCCATFGTSFLKAKGAAVKTRQKVKDLPSIEWTFTAAPQQLVVDGETVTYTPSGYVLETLENGVWSHPERFGGASCTLSDDNAVRRLTWRWRSDRGTMIILR